MSEFVATEVPQDQENPFKFEETPEAPKTKSKAETNVIVDSLKKFYFGIGVGVRVIDVRDSLTICNNAEELAESWRTVLDNDPKLRRMMKGFIQGGGWSTVLIAHLMVALPIAEHHGVDFKRLIKRKADVVDDESIDDAA